jgi:hypothetical protein
MKRALSLLATVLGGAALVLLLLDPRRPLGPVFILLAAAVAWAVLPSWLR